MTAQTRICVIDDSALVRDALALGLDDEGDFDVFIAPDGQAGLALIERVHPDVVLTDLKMPGIDGEALIHHLRARFPALPIVAMSGQVESVELDGADIFLRKPFNVAEARKAIESARARRQLM
jgi:CheY-like chemotaxis protein